MKVSELWLQLAAVKCNSLRPVARKFGDFVYVMVEEELEAVFEARAQHHHPAGEEIFEALASLDLDGTHEDEVIVDSLCKVADDLDPLVIQGLGWADALKHGEAGILEEVLAQPQTLLHVSLRDLGH